VALGEGTSPRLPSDRMIRWEIFAVFAVSLGASALNAALSLIGSLLQRQSLGSQQALLVGPEAANNWLDLVLELASIATALAPVVLVFYLLARTGEGPKDIGLDATQPVKDTLRGAVLAAVIGGAGLALYLAAYHLKLELNVVPEDLPAVWWRTPVLILSAAHDGILEETLVIGYLLTRLDQLRWNPWRAIVFSAVLRGSYHLYQGFGAFIGNAVMGLIFGYLYRRWGRVTPLIIAHTLIDAVTFVGYAALIGRVSWLPKP
jgi:membrane protease YdiL (CAAX protease family)